nr:histidine phosphatase family protein [Polymorphobacter sp.]
MILLIRHTEVARIWRGRCYGITDTGLSRAGAAHAAALAPEIASWRPDIVVHSGLRRAHHLARLIAATARAEIHAVPDWRERDFGDWEGQTWLQIHRATGDAMDGMIDAPDHFRPGGGETTTELANRAVTAFATLPPGRVAVVAHGGPIAAILGRRQNHTPRDWLALIPACGGSVEIARRDRIATRSR